MISSTDIKAELARRSHLNFVKHMFETQNNEPYIIGQHTKEVCSLVDNAIDRYKNGENTFLIVKIPFRHGKTEIISRHLPIRFIGEFPNKEVIVSTYSADFSYTLSRQARNKIQSDFYSHIYPGIGLDSANQSVGIWGVTKDDVVTTGSVKWTGVSGSITGRGYHLGIIDDFLKNREEAESAVIREKQWDWFTNTFFTRRSPVSITIILATPWHVDDIIGRIENEMKGNPDFPSFNVVTFPAIDERYEEGYLFPERFPANWYTQQKASLGQYGTASLLQCNPTERYGNLLNVSKINKIPYEDMPTDIHYVRAWDLASTEKELIKNDPDYTVGCLVGLKYVDDIPHLYIKDIKRGQWKAPERDRIIERTAEEDQDRVRIGIEAVGGYKDTYDRIFEQIGMKYNVEKITVSRDKLIRAMPLEPIFEAGNVYVANMYWTDALIDELGSFPSAAHDDQVDSLSSAYEMLKNIFSSFSDLKMEAGTSSSNGIDRFAVDAV